MNGRNCGRLAAVALLVLTLLPRGLDAQESTLTLSGDPQGLVISTAVAGFGPDPVWDEGTMYSVTAAGTLVSPGEEMGVTYEVTVPADAGLAGTYWSMIMVEPTEPITEAPEDPERPAIGMRTVVRFGIQVATHVRGKAEHRLRLGDPRVTVDDDGGRHLRFELVNEGDVGYRPKVSVERYDETGVLVAMLEAQRGLICPGRSTLQQFGLSDLPARSYEAVVVVDTGALQVFGAQFTLNLGSSD